MKEETGCERGRGREEGSCSGAASSDGRTWTEVVGNELEPHRNQKGRMTVLTETGSAEGDNVGMHIISYSSSLIGRVCRATLQKETNASSAGVKEAVGIRATTADACGRLDLKSWERSAAGHMHLTWMVDCKSLEEYLKNPTFTACSDKRLLY